MVALISERDTPQRDGRDGVVQAAAAKIFYAGAILALDAGGKGTPGATSATLKGLGRVKRTVTSGAADVVLVEYERGVFRFANSDGADAITAVDIGASAYMVDDQTVAKTSGTNTRSIAGVIRDVDAQGVWVEF